MDCDLVAIVEPVYVALMELIYGKITMRGTRYVPLPTICY